MQLGITLLFLFLSKSHLINYRHFIFLTVKETDPLYNESTNDYF